MAKLLVFENLSLDGYFTDAHGDMSFAHQSTPDPEWDAFVSGNASGNGRLLFGRVTYEMMASFWPTAQAAAALPSVAKYMNAQPKLVFSRTMAQASWQNSSVHSGDPVAEVRRLKQESAENMALMGSGSIVSALAQAGLVDEFQFVVVPVVLGAGRTLFAGGAQRLSMQLTKTRSFKNGHVLLCYTPRR